MATTIPIATHDMATKIEDDPLTCHLVDAVIDTYMWGILQYNYIML